MHCSKMTALISGMLLGAISLSAIAITPQTNADTGRIILFTAGKTDLNTIKNRTGTWEEGDLCPVLELVKHNNEDWIKFSYRGAKGLALSSFPVAERIADMKTAGHEFYGIALEICFPSDDFAKLDVSVHARDGGYITRRITLAPGVQTCIVDGGRFRPPEDRPDITSFDWNQIHMVSLNYRTAANNNKKPSFLLREIYLMQRPPQTAESRRLEIAETRPVLEIFPATAPVLMDGDLGGQAWASAAQITDFHYYQSHEMTTNSPLTAKIMYDSSNLYIRTDAFFPTPPIANVTQKDGVVWQDEAAEYFFCVENDNRSITQFAINAIDTVFDFKTYHDPDSGKWRRMMDTGIEYSRKTRYENSIFTSELAFNMKSLDIDLGRTKFIGLQLAQNYRNRADERLRQLAWTRTSAFPLARHFGLIVFNKKPFGPGAIILDGIRKSPGNNDRAEFTADFRLEQFPAGEYKIETMLVASRKETAVLSDTISISRGGVVKESTVFPGMTDANVDYSLYISMANSGGDAKVFGANFVNSVEPADLFERPILVPAPKRTAWQAGRFPVDQYGELWLADAASGRTEQTASLFQKQFADFTGVNLQSRKDKDDAIQAQKGVILRIRPAVQFQDEKVILKPEGYHLSVQRDRIVITGADEPGLFYGGITLFQLLRNAMRLGEGRTVPAVEILDWPDMSNRVVNLEHPRQIYKTPFQETRGIEYLMEWADRFVAGNKFNLLFLDVSDVVRLKRRPEFDGPDKMYSLDDLRALAEFCRDRFISISPRWQCGGHANWWLLKPHPELREKGQKNQADVTHPEHDAIVRDCMLDIIEAVQPQYASPKGDEWWHGRQAGETPDELLRGMARADVFLKFNIEMYEWLKGQGIRMTLFEDMLSPFHNGKRYDIYKIVDALPKDIIITWWKGGQYLDDGLPWFVDKGFTDIWALCTGFYTLSAEQQKHINGFGKTMYSFHNWFLRDNSNFYYYLPYILFRTADYAWNMQADDGQSIEDYVENGNAYAAASMFATMPNPRAGAEFYPVDIAPAATHSFNAVLKELNMNAASMPAERADVGLVPMLFAPKDGKNCILLQDDAPAMMEINRKAASLIFLHTAFVDLDLAQKEGIKLPGHRDWPYGYPFGKYIVRYQDGSMVELKLRSGENILPATMGPFFRNTLDHRYTYLLYDEGGNSFACYQWEWVNPNPDREIKEIAVMGEGVYDSRVLKTILFAITARDTK